MPVTPDIAILLALSGVGILSVLTSRSVSARRIVLPAPLLIFHATIFLLVQRSGALANIPIAVIVAGLAANAVVTWRRARICPDCGRTVF